ncbi:MAG: thioredoxin domain-containing protein [Hyphomicrobiales bacterium]
MPRNELALAASPYLLQHKDNPVHWRMWGVAALEEAGRLDKPILLSVGYAACHWCHVMAHESFEDAEVAAVMNELFVAIKVDREERPDIDQVYMTALHALGQPGGWPLTMFLTPAGEPFWGGTYFPKEARYGRPGFVTVLRQVASAYRSDPERVAKNTAALRQAILETKPAVSEGEITPSSLDLYAERLAANMDPVHGGLGGAPKFPNPPLLEFLWRHGARRSDAASRQAFLLTLRRMCEGGIHDQLGGGFARYSVDERWLVPHFEKMLYDNAQLIELLSLAWRETGEAVFEAAARDTVAWLRREMRAKGDGLRGAFCASLDADSEGVEGKFYVWTRGEIDEVLGPRDAAFFARHYDARAAGNWLDEHQGEPVTILNRLQAPRPTAEDELRLATLRSKLFERRGRRVRPGLDDKILADWNGFTIAALVNAAVTFGETAWIGMAREAFDFIAATMLRKVDAESRLGHAWRDGTLVFPGMASDYAAMMSAALALAEVGAGSDAEGLLELAQRLALALDAHHQDEATGFLCTSADDARDVVFRSAPTTDEAVPNANAVYAQALLKLSSLTGDDSFRARADRLIGALTPAALANPFGHLALLNAIDQRLRNVDIVIVGPDAERLRAAALAVTFKNRSVRLARNPAAAGGFAEIAAYPRDRSAAFICADGRCSLPVTRPEEIAERVAKLRG